MVMISPENTKGLAELIVISAGFVDARLEDVVVGQVRVLQGHARPDHPAPLDQTPRAASTSCAADHADASDLQADSA